MAELSTGQRILIVEESATLRYILGKLAQKQGYELLLLDSFQSAINTLEAATQNLHAVMIGWPGDEHHVAATELLVLLDREPYSGVPVVLLSNDAELEILNWTSTRRLTAMVPWENYQEAIVSIQAMLDPKMVMDVEQSSGTRRNMKPTRVLFVDDSKSIVLYYQKLLTRNGYDVETASSVQQAQKLAVERSFDIAIVDYFMPDENGYVLCQKFRDDPRTENIRTAVITGTYLDSVIRDCLKAGAVECMFKNEAEELFLARVAAMSRFVEIQRSIEKQRESLAAILESVGEGVFGVDNEGKVTFLNPASLQILGIENAQSLIGMYAWEVFHCGNEMSGIYNDPLKQSYISGEELRGWETKFKHQQGKALPVECTLYPLRMNGKKEGCVIAFRDISNQKLLEEKLRWQATHDHLTEIYNRRYLESQLEDELQNVQRCEIMSAVAYLDLDRFKYVNDAVGHDVGDQILIDVANTLSSQLRINDIVARIGGDEFAILLKNVNKDLAVTLVENCRQAISKLSVIKDEKKFTVNASVGIAIMDASAITCGDVLADADLACHIAKRQGRNQAHIFDAEDEQRNIMGNELGWSERLRDAIRNNGFELHFQPVLEMENIDLTNLPAQDGLLWQQHLKNHEGSFCYEVLMRMRSETNELFYPNAFLPTAERYGMMMDIDMWVIEHAMMAMQEAANPIGRLSLSINVSGNTLDNDESALRIKKLLRQYDVPAEALIFEITETSAIANIEQANHFIAELNEIGCRFSLDDFGSGFCTFSQLKNLPSDFVKIDGQFVKNMARGSTDRAIVTAMNDVAHSLHRATVAEYVESPEVVRLLKICGVDRVQGFYISPPLLQLPHDNVVKFPIQYADNRA